MEFWLLATLQRHEQQLAVIKSTVEETHTLLQRLAILATLWAAVATLGYNSQPAQDLLAGAIKTALRLP
jgi:hypothetical protein